MTFDRCEPEDFNQAHSPADFYPIHFASLGNGLTTLYAPVRSLNFTWKPFRLTQFQQLLNVMAIRKKGILAVFKVAGGLKTELGDQFETYFMCCKW